MGVKDLIVYLFRVLRCSDESLNFIFVLNKSSLWVSVPFSYWLFLKKIALKTKAKPRNTEIVPIKTFLLKFVLSSTDSELKPNKNS